MSGPEIRVFPTLEELSREAAARFAERAREQRSGRAFFAAALSGGSTPHRLYEFLADPAWDIPWERVHLFQVDERCVPPDHPESNYRMIREALLDRAPIPLENFHRLPADLPDPEEAAACYAEELARVLQPKEGEFPRLDLLLLGMGADGHTASLFPSTPALEERRLWVRPNFVPRLGACRVTLTFPVLNSAREVILLVSGGEKADSLRRVLEGSRLVEHYPVQRVQPASGRVSWFLDAAAAQLLTTSLERE